MQRSSKTYLVAALVVLVIVLSWMRPIDDYTDHYLNDSIKTAAVIFAVSRAINAAISVTQSAHVGVGVASVAPGEALDPINDLIERFSEVMTVALAALALQKILSEIAAHWLFNALISVSGVALLIALATGRYRHLAIKAFALFVVIRLMLPLVVLSNSIVDQLFIDNRVSVGQGEIENLKQSVSLATSHAAAEEIDEIEQGLTRYREESQELTAGISALRERIDGLQRDKPSRPWWKPEFLSSDPELRSTNLQIGRLQRDLESRRSRLRDLDDKIAAATDQRDCLQKRSRGEECSWLETIRRTGDWLKAPSLDVGDKIDSLITLMTLIILRSILLPLAFWVVIYKTTKWIWRTRLPLAG